jgi:hypothetical protein
MRNAVVMFALVVGVLMLPGIGDVSAQSPTLAKVPFSFIVEGTVMPAGEYRLVVRPGDPSMLQIMSTGGGAAMFVNVSSSEARTAAGAPTLVFRRAGTGYFLSRVNVPGENVQEIAVPTDVAGLRLALPGGRKPAIQG